jgi:fumarate reductase iron-sulfur subunit
MGRLTIEPLRNMPRIKDLACDMSEFFGKWRRAGGVFRGSRTRDDQPMAVDPQSRNRQAANAAIECINGAVCYSACDVVAARPDHLGPAALNRAWTLINDVRHADRSTTLAQAMADGGCASCHTLGSCAQHCPVGISPTASIAGLKRLSLLSFLRRTPE